jgi:hypothetical protein
MSRQAQNIKPVQDANTPPNVIANTARFNTQFNRGLIKHSKYKIHENMDQHITPDNEVIVSSYGRGLWIIDFNVLPEPLPYEEYCQEDCIMRSLDDPEILTNPIDWWDRDVTVFLNGRVNGLVLSEMR